MGDPDNDGISETTLSASHIIENEVSVLTSDHNEDSKSSHVKVTVNTDLNAAKHKNTVAIKSDNDTMGTAADGILVNEAMNI